ncbi:terminase small subunit [Paenibacillus xylanexedens]|uniref:terminase small subunit n=1 Tax=Paenibacillus xylanexedens TaxID=528191 RepID=UPI0011A367B7|nr:terminase small subunit [Paenibacillus xylanexedens]
MALTDKQMNFVNEYMKDMNATAAYLRAGYKCTEEAARRAASRLLTNVDVMSEIGQRTDKMQKDSGMSVQWVLEQYKEIIVNNLEEDPAVAKGALDSVAKHYGMFKDKTEIDLKVSKKLEEFFS